MRVFELADQADRECGVASVYWRGTGPGLPSARHIVLQPVVGGARHETCIRSETEVRASWQHKHIDSAITRVVSGWTDSQVTVIAGFSPEVRTCEDYRDTLGHLTAAGASAVAEAIARYYAATPTGSDCAE